MSYLGLDVAKPVKPVKRKDVYVFPVTAASQIIVDEENNERLKTLQIVSFDTATGELVTKTVGDKG